VPQIAIEYSANLAADFDAPALALRIHGLIGPTIDTELGNCKTRLREIERWAIGDGSPDLAMLHVDLRILSGRTAEQKTRLGEAVLGAASEALGAPKGLKVQLTVEVRDLDRDHYHKRLIAG